jgi:hypothetical protein
MVKGKREKRRRMTEEEEEEEEGIHQLRRILFKRTMK